MAFTQQDITSEIQKLYIEIFPDILKKSITAVNEGDESVPIIKRVAEVAASHTIMLLESRIEEIQAFQLSVRLLSELQKHFYDSKDLLH